MSQKNDQNNVSNTLFAMELTGETTTQKIDRLRSVILASPEPEKATELLELFGGKVDLKNMDNVLDAMILVALEFRHKVETLKRQNKALRQEILDHLQDG